MRLKILLSILIILTTFTFFRPNIDFFNLAERSAFLDSNHASRVAYQEALERRLVNVGRAPFGIAHKRFNCKSFLASIKDLDFLHIAWLYNTFGKNYSCLNKLFNDPRLITLQTNLINEPGHRNRRLEKHEFLYGISSPSQYDRLLKSKNPKLKAKFLKYVRPLQDLLVSRLQPHTECLINPGLESNVSARAGKVLVSWAKEAFPMCRIIWNPIAKTSTPKGTGADLIEQHGWFPNFTTHSCTFNNDGSDINFPERKTRDAILHEKDHNHPKNYLNAGNSLQSAVEEFANQCEVIYLWVGEDNCFGYNEQMKAWHPPLTRSCNVGPVNKLVAKEVKRAQEKGKRAPRKFVYTSEDEKSFQGCTSIRNPRDGFKKGFLLKQSEFSDRGGVIITPIRASSIEVVHRGVRVDKYQKTGKFDTRDLWRSNKTILQYPLKVAIKLKTGSETICYRVDNPRIRND